MQDACPAVESLTSSGAIHAKRRAEELEMSADAVQDVGIDPIMARAVAQRLRWKEALGLQEHFKGVVPPSYKEAIDAIEKKLTERNSNLTLGSVSCALRSGAAHGPPYLHKLATEAESFRGRSMSQQTIAQPGLPARASTS